VAANLIRRRVLGLLAGACLAACAVGPAARVPDAAAMETQIFLVRHAEKEQGDDPGLTAEGTARAAALSARLGGEGITEIWSTKTRRTEATAAPLASALGLTVQPYEAGALEALAENLRQRPGAVLVVGHSNTTGELASALGAEPGPAIDEAAEFDRLYVIAIDRNGLVRSRIERYDPASSTQTGDPE
jgi:broad specificity phosphatase PhoE